MEKITYQQYLAMLTDPETPDKKIAEYSIVKKGVSAFDVRLAPDPEQVTMTPDQESLENAMAIGNDIARWRRKRRFERAVGASTKPILVAEGDSWFQFPILVDEVVDQLGGEYLISCCAAAGDTARNMVFGLPGKGRTEYMDELRNLNGRVKGFLFSAAGNDIIGEDEDLQDGTPVLEKILKSAPGSSDPADYVNMGELSRRLAFIAEAYLKVIQDIHSEPGLERLPIFIHGYDVPFPFPWKNDARNPFHADKDQWLGRAFERRGIRAEDRDLRRNILGGLINALYDTLGTVAGDPAVSFVHVVDCRGAMPDPDLWIDEIHGTDEGFKRVAQRFSSKVGAVL